MRYFARIANASFGDEQWGMWVRVMDHPGEIRVGERLLTHVDGDDLHTVRVKDVIVVPRASLSGRSGGSVLYRLPALRSWSSEGSPSPDSIDAILILNDIDLEDGQDLSRHGWTFVSR